MAAFQAFTFVLELMAIFAVWPVGASHPNALWGVVHGLCVVDMKLTSRPAPCLAVNRKGGYAVVEDLFDATQVLLVPTARVSGIESPKLLAKGAPNYWQEAWDARRYFERRAGRKVARDEVGLAVNSVYGRTQNQLHIHIDCVRAEVRATLRAHEDEIGRDWARLDFELAGRRYRVLRLYGAELGSRDPFRFLANDDSYSRADMGRQTLAVIGATFGDGRPGFILLTATAGTRENPSGASEELLDHRCAVLGSAGQA